MKRITVILSVVALMAAACGDPGVRDAGPVTVPTSGGNGAPSGGDSPSGGSGAGDDPGAPPGGQPSGGQPSTGSPSGGSGDPGTPATDQTTDLKVYFLMAEIEDRGHRPGPFVVPVYRAVPETRAVATAAIQQLLAGPTQTERSGSPAISSAVPEGTLLLGIEISDGLATIDLSREFESGGGTFSMAARLAQVTYTLTQFPTVDRVAFRLDGRPVEVFSSEGLVLDGPVARDDYLDLLPIIFVDGPVWGGPAGSPLRVVGTAAVFEATFQWALADGDGRILQEGFAMTDEGMGWGDFDFTIRYSVDRPQMGALIVWDYSMEDGSRQNVREYPLHLES